MPQATDPVSPELTAAARDAMVDSQVRPNKVIDPRIVGAMRTIPREAFLPPSLRVWAYADDDVKLGGGRVMMSPMVTARLLQGASVRLGERVLLIGAGTGYTAALLDACGARVTALEEDAALLAIAGSALAEWAPGTNLVQGALAAGWAAAAPYDLVMIEGAVESLPAGILSQIDPNGRLVMVRAAPGEVARAVMGRPSGGSLSFVPLFDCAVAVLPAMRQAPAFVF